MAARLTDRQKKKIIADYVQLGSYNAAAKLNGVSNHTVKKVVSEAPETSKKLQQKKRQNTADILAYMDSTKGDVCEVLGICLAALKNPDKYAKSTPREIATTMAILIDKYTAHIGDNIADDQSEDALSKSLRELGEGLESDGD
ncbi:MAG: helix-turn-helix domain-containing protein [Oscillospiraceae bacterium]|nr:helix-turn-helix domain-containing protein [Oscillospiraceae bacterium]